MLDNLGLLMWMLAVTALILFLAWRASRWIALHGGNMPALSNGFALSGGTSRRFRVVGQLPLGRTARLIAVRIGNQCCLLGVTEQSVTVVKECGWDEVAELFRTPDAPQSSAAFPDVLRDFLHKTEKK